MAKNPSQSSGLVAIQSRRIAKIIDYGTVPHPNFFSFRHGATILRRRKTGSPARTERASFPMKAVQQGANDWPPACRGETLAAVYAFHDESGPSRRRVLRAESHGLEVQPKERGSGNLPMAIWEEMTREESRTTLFPKRPQEWEKKILILLHLQAGEGESGPRRPQHRGPAHFDRIGAGTPGAGKCVGRIPQGGRIRLTCSAPCWDSIRGRLIAINLDQELPPGPRLQTIVDFAGPGAARGD